ncbi:MAG: TolC family protein [Pyrinomonadaceae bacterium]
MIGVRCPRLRPLVILLCLAGQILQVSAQQPTGASPQSSAPVQAEPALPPYYDYPYGSETTTRRTLTVDDAVALALANASVYQQALLDERSAREDVRQARTAFLPQFSAPLSYIGTTPSQVHVPGDPLIFSFASAIAINETTAFLNATGPIDLSGRLRASLRRSRALLGAARAGTQVARRELVLATVDAYYGLVLARQRRRLADETLALAEGFVNLAERLRQRGEGEEADVFRARSAAAARRDELEQARLAESAAMSLLRVLTGVDFVTHIGVTRPTQDVPTAADFMGYTEELIKARPELAQLDAQAQAARAEERVARSELRPDLIYSLNGGFDAADVHHLRQYSGGAAVISLNIPLWNFGASKSRATQARLRARALEVQRESLVQQLRQEFYTQRAAALSALARIKTAEQAANAAQQNLNLIFVRYRQGDASITDVIDAQANYADTRLAYYQAIGDYHTARVRLEVDPTQKTVGPNASMHGAAAGGRVCALTEAQAPALGGLRLGLNATEVAAAWPGLKVEPVNEFGVAQAVLRGGELSTRAAGVPFAADLDAINLEFIDGRLALARFNYRATNKWESKDQFLSAVAAQLGLKGPWQAFYDWQDKSIRDEQDLRDLALECAGFRLRVGIGIEGIGADQTPHVTLEDVAAARTVRQREDEKKRRAQEPPKP